MTHSNAGNSSSPLAFARPVVKLLFVAALLCGPYAARGDNAIVVPDGVYTIHPSNAQSLVLDASAGAGQAVVLAAPASSGQSFTVKAKGGGFYELNLPGNLALTIADTSGADGTKVIVDADKGLDTQLWSIVPNGLTVFNLIPKLQTAKGLDNYGGAIVAGPTVDVWGNSGSDPHLQWTLVTPSGNTLSSALPSGLKDGSYTIHPSNAPDLLLDGSAGSGQPVVLGSAAASGQTWAISFKGQYCLIKLPGNLALTIADPTGALQSKILVAPDAGADTQLWAIVPNGTNTFNIVPKLAPGSGVDNYFGATTPGPSVDLFANAGSDPHLQWAITPGGH